MLRKEGLAPTPPDGSQTRDEPLEREQPKVQKEEQNTHTKHNDKPTFSVASDFKKLQKKKSQQNFQILFLLKFQKIMS